jgi:hypothetical protein
VIVAVPTATPVTTPLPDPTVAIAALLLLHAPAPAPSLSAIVEPIHIGAFPLIATDVLVTVISVVAIQPEVIL